MKKTLIITGGSKGIGKATIELFLQNQWHIINVSRTACNMDSVTNVSIDLTDPNWPTQHQDSLVKLVKDSDQICLVHNASICIRDTVQEFDIKTFRDTLEINVIAPAILNKVLLPHIKPKSSIIYIGSTLSEKAVSNNASYTTSKHAIVGLMRSTCQDLNNTFIHTCCICPGITDTEMLRARVNHDENILNSLSQIQSEKRLIEPKEIADVIWFAANHAVINGSVIHAHLGQIEH